MTKELRQTISRLQANLIRIDNGERFFFNITQYKNLGLVWEKDVYYTDSTGDKERLRTDYFLTDKAKQYIKVAV